MITSRKYIELKPFDGGYDIVTDGPTIRMIALQNDIIRLRASFDGKFEEGSYCLALTAWDDRLDDFMKDHRQKVAPHPMSLSEHEGYLLFETDTMKVQMIKEPFGIRVFNLNNEMIYSDLLGRSFVKDHLNRVFHYNNYDAEGDHFFGFGERAGHLDKKEKRMRMTPKDAIGQDPEFADPMYKHIPFYIRINEKTNHALGLFYHNSYDTVFDMGNEISGYYDRYSYYSAEGGDVDLFLINGPSMKEVVSNYTLLTGRQAMPPKQSLGFTTSTMYYGELDKDCDQEIYYVMDKHKATDITADSFKMSSGYTTGHGTQKRYVFNWNLDKFPDPQKFFDTMNDKGINLIPNIKPGILLAHPFMDTFVKNDVFVKNPDGVGFYEGPWWGGIGRYFDFSKASGRETWKYYLKKQLLELGTVSIWNDNCEYDGVEDREAFFDYDGVGGTGAFLRVLQGNLMGHIGIEAVNEVYPNKRPYIINRAGFAGIQKYAQTWAGDNLTDWRTPKFNIATIIGMGLSGVANSGCDIGGFAGPAPEGELLLRWIQNGIFQPRFCINSANTDNKVTEAWMYEENNDLVRAAYSLRYQLISYLYTLMHEAHTEGTPIMRPLFFEFENDLMCYEDKTLSFMLGSALLVANVLDKGAKKRKLYLPKGCDWYRYDDRMKPYEGGQWVEIDVDLTSIPMFLRSDRLFYTNNRLESVKNDTVRQLDLYFAGATPEQKIYDDDGETYDYRDGGYALTTFEVTGDERRSILLGHEGSYKSGLEQIVLHSMHQEKSAYWVTVDDRKIQQFLQREQWEVADEGWCYNGDEFTVLVKLPYDTEIKEIVICYEHFDLIGMEDPVSYDL